MAQFGFAFDHPQSIDHARNVGCFDNARERGLQAKTKRGGQAVSVPFDSDSLAGEILLAQQPRQIDLRRGVGAVFPDSHIANVARARGLAQIGGAREQCFFAVGAHQQALKKHIAETIEAGEPIQSFLPEKNRAVQTGGGDCAQNPRPPRGELRRRKMTRGRQGGLIHRAAFLARGK